MNMNSLFKWSRRGPEDEEEQIEESNEMEEGEGEEEGAETEEE